MAENTTKRPPTIAPFRPPTVAEVAAYFKLKDWERARKVAETKAAIQAGTYDDTGPQLDVAVERMLPDVLDKGDFTASVADSMNDADVADAMLPGLTLPAAGVGTEEERAAWDRDNEGDRFE